jgi:hypothetical protein
MANKFEIQVVALDKATSVFRKINNQMAQTMRPVTRAQRQLGLLAREMHLDKVTKSMRGLSQASMKVASGLGLAVGPMEALLGLGVAGGIAATAAAVASLGARWGRTGFEISRTAQLIGVSTDELQRYRGAAQLAGVSQDAMTNSLAQLGRTLQDAQFGRNAEAYAVLNKFGIGIRRNAQGVVDIVGTMKDLSAVISQITNPQVQEKLSDILGVREALPLLRQGPDAIERYAKQAEKFGLVAGGDALAGAEKFTEAMNRLKASIEGVANSWGQKLTPALTRGMDLLTDTLQKRGFGGFFWDLFSGRLTREAAFGAGAPAARRSSGMITQSLPGDIRFNNPGNLRVPGSATGFQRFATAQEGLNAMARQIGLYANRDNLRTISSIVGKYAPPNENDTSAYIADVSKRTGFAPDQQLDVNDPKVMAPLLSAMVRHEQGRQPFSDQQLAQAAQSVKVEVAFKNAPPGTEAKVNANGAWTPTRVSYAMPTTTTP